MTTKYLKIKRPTWQENIEDQNKPPSITEIHYLKAINTTKQIHRKVTINTVYPLN